jgi:hypothetical protein
LKSEQTGIIILKTELKNLLKHPSYDFHVFIDYDIEHNEKLSEHQLYAGKVKVDAKIVMSDQFWPNFKTTEGKWCEFLVEVQDYIFFLFFFQFSKIF